MNGDLLSVSEESLPEDSVDNEGKDFVLIFPVELSHKLFKYLSEKDIYNCAQCSIAWRRAINTNSQWKFRCARKGWYKVGQIVNPYQLGSLPSYSEENEFRFRTSPRFIPPPVPSLRMEELCDWAMYFRERFHLENNWKYGRYVIHKLIPPDEPLLPIVYNACASNSNYVVAGTTLGYLFIWKTVGKPNLVQSFVPAKLKTEIERILINDEIMLVLTSDGILLCYSVREEMVESEGELQPKYVLKISGNQIPDVESELKVKLISWEEDQDFRSEKTEEDFEKNDLEKDCERVDVVNADEEISGLSYELFPINASDIVITLMGEYFYLSLMLESTVTILDTATGKLFKKLTLPRGMQIASKTQIAGRRKLLLSAELDGARDQLPLSEKTYHVLVYERQHVLERDDARPKEFASTLIPSDVQLDPEEERLVWVGKDSIVVGKSLMNQQLFSREEESYVDHLTTGNDVVVYHLYDGQVMVINWSGVVRYRIKIRIGIARGIILTPDYLITAGDARTLTVHDRKTGELYHRVYHQPCKISWLSADITKIITVGREEEDAPVLVGYW